MAIEDLGYAAGSRPTGHAPSRVRTMLKRVHDKLQSERAASQSYTLFGGALITGSDLIPMIDRALAEWGKLDDLIIAEKNQRKRIASLATDYVEFFVAIHGQVLRSERKTRKKRTAAQNILLGEKIRETRRLRGTLGKRQKKNIKANAEGVTVTIGGPSPGIKRRGGG
jgi:hypothetical protein